MGRNCLEWTERECNQFKELCAIFCTQEEICRVMSVDKKALKKLINQHFFEEITGSPKAKNSKLITFQDAFDYFSADGKMSLRRKQFKLAEDGDRTMLIFLGKCYLGQNDKQPATDAKEKMKEQPKQATGNPPASFQMFKGRSPASRKPPSKAVGM